MAATPRSAMSAALGDTWRTIGELLLPRRGARAPRSRMGTARLQQRSWRALFVGRSRPLLVPADNRAAQESSLKFFITSARGLLYARTLLRANDWLPRVSLLPELTLPAADGPTLLDQLPVSESSQFAFQVGTPGPYQKASVLITSGEGSPQALAKIALRESADGMVGTEARWLAELANCGALEGRVPRLLRHGTAQNGRGYLALSVAPGYATTLEFTPAHAAFLRDLARVRTTLVAYPESSAAIYLGDVLGELAGGLSGPRRRILEDAVGECRRRLESWEGPFVLAHGDFAPWNTRVDDGGVFAFDWEYAREGSLALQDIFHFHLAPLAVSGRGIAPSELKSVARRVREFAQEAWPGHEWSERVIGAQALGYLLQTVLCYTASRGRLMEKHPVIRSYCRLIERRARWMR